LSLAQARRTRLHGRPVALGQVLERLCGALQRWTGTGRSTRVDRDRQPLGPIQDDEHTLLDIRTPIDEVCEQVR
jgi:hypothetical protein